MNSTSSIRVSLFVTFASLLVATGTVRADDFQLEPGFISLFNGKDLTGWCYNKTNVFDGKTATDDGRYSGKDGIFIVHPRTPRLMQIIWTTQQFPKDFVLKLEFRAEVNADSGIFVRKPQLQCRDYLVAGGAKKLKKKKKQGGEEKKKKG